MSFFYCSECGIRLSYDVEELEDDSELNEEKEKQHIPKGKYAVSKDKKWLSKAEYLTNQEDIVNLEIDGEWGEGKSKHYGCCGLDGNSGLNSRCENGHLLATKITDCNIPHLIILDTNKVELREE